MCIFEKPILFSIMKENSDKDGRGGARPGSGAKRKADVEKANEVFLTMIRTVKNVNTDDEAKQALAKELFGFERGQMFIAEHVFGKPKEKVDITSGDSPIQNFNLSKLSDQELSIILKLHAGQPIDTDGEPDQSGIM